MELAAALSKRGAKVVGFDPPMNQRDLSPIKGLIEHHDALDSIAARPDGRLAVRLYELASYGYEVDVYL